MIVTFVSQCEKKALKRTRRILDSFANRIGDNVWQTAITEDGLDTVKKLLRSSATKSTAVSCHRNRGSQTTELVWIVGNKRKFNELGIVPVNSTRRDLIHQDWENRWQNLTAMKLIATLAALLHDIGKSSVLFQRKLHGQIYKGGDPYRHEWVSLQLFLWLIDGCTSDNAVFDRLANIQGYLQTPPILTESHYRQANLALLPPLAQWLAWLIVTHHRLPPLPMEQENNAKDDGYTSSSKKSMLQSGNSKYRTTASEFYRKLKAINRWVRNPHSQGNLAQNWQFDALVLHSPALQKQLKRYAEKAKANPTLQTLSQSGAPISNPFLLNLSRLILMTGDHNYSSLSSKDQAQRTHGAPDWQTVIANTERTKQQTQPNQALDEHLIGVAQYSHQFAHALPAIQTALPTLKDHDPLAKNTAHPRFTWQNDACKLTRSIQQQSSEHGFFAINMASTGCGKTIANARIAYALADPQRGTRFTIALGLRTLTLQTGDSLRQDLDLKAEQLAVLVGGRANKQLFDLNQIEDENQHGNESADTLLDEYVDSRFDPADYDQLKLGILTANPSAQQLLYSPIISCTIDHLMQASEQQRGGRYIIPTLRLLSSDLILDEPDDFSDADLPALSRLVHLAGLYGSRLILSSATLQPDQIHGLFDAYLAGRTIYNAQFNLPAPQIPCLWSDEQHSEMHTCSNSQQLDNAHHAFLRKRQSYLKQQPIRRIGEILALQTDYDSEDDMAELDEDLYRPLAAQLLEHAINYHHRHHLNYHDKTVSVGLIRMANINPLMQTALALYQTNTIPADTHIHLAVYHSRQVLLLRNQLEVQLDAILNRKNGQQPTDNASIQHAIATHANAAHHLFIVLASPVCEVGRDHDYDWAIVEPSSMRSLIQLAGRINRHRPDRLPESPNIGIWQHNIRTLKGKQYCLQKPGYESSAHPLASHDLKQLIAAEQLARIDAQPRIIKPDRLAPRERLADLEHQALAELMHNSDINIVNAYWQDGTFNRQHTHLIRLSPFRQSEAENDYIIRPENGENIPYHREQIDANGGFHGAKSAGDRIQSYTFSTNPNAPITPWLNANLAEQIDNIADKLALKTTTAAIRFAGITLPKRDNKPWHFHEAFGCWQDDSVT